MSERAPEDPAVRDRNGNEVRVLRGGRLESRHAVHAVVVGRAEDGGDEAAFGDPGLLAFWRSSMKPFQALPLVMGGAAEAWGLSPEDIALCCASHAGTPAHVAGVLSLLERLGLSEDHLRCGPHAPFDDAAAREVLRSGGEYRPVHNNCSGKHAGMLAVALHEGWPLEGYWERDHPVQVEIRERLAGWLDVDPEELVWATDGCGVPTPYLTLRQMARAYARLGRAVRERNGAAARVGDAMRRHPEVVSGPGRSVTRLMKETGGRIVAKEGAEGVFCAAGPDAGWGLALKVVDGRRRAVGPAVLQVLAALHLLEPPEREELADLRRVTLRNTRDEVVGEIAARVEPRFTPASSRGRR